MTIFNGLSKPLRVGSLFKDGWRWLLQNPRGCVADDSPLAGDHLRALGYTLLHGLPWSSKEGTGIKFVGVTSCYRGEGVSMIARLMATTAASSGTHEVLLIDADVDRTSVHEVFDLSWSSDQTEASPDKKSEQFKLQATQLPNLHTLVANCGNAGTAYESLKSLRAILADCGDRFDLVVVDIPALTESQSAGNLCSLLDGFVLVVEDECVRREVARQTHEKLARAGGNILGVVLNKRNRHIPDWLYRSL